MTNRTIIPTTVSPSWKQLPPIHAASLYDAVILYASGLNMTLAKHESLTGENIVENIKSMGKFDSK